MRSPILEIPIYDPSWIMPVMSRLEATMVTTIKTKKLVDVLFISQDPECFLMTLETLKVDFRHPVITPDNWRHEQVRIYIDPDKMDLIKSWK